MPENMGFTENLESVRGNDVFKEKFKLIQKIIK